MADPRPWYLATLTAVGGWASALWNAPQVFAFMGALGTVALLAMAARRANVTRRPLAVAMVVSGAILFVGSQLLDAWTSLISYHQALALSGVGIQVLVVGLRMPRRRLQEDPSRVLAPPIGHAFALAGALLLYVDGEAHSAPAVLASMLGYVVLFMDLVWVRRQDNPRGYQGQSWEAWLLVFLALLLTTADLMAYMNLQRVGPLAIERIMESLVAATLLGGLVLAAGPPPLPPRFKLRPGGTGEFWIDGLAFLVLLETVMFLLLFGAPQVVWPVFYVLTGFLVLAAGFEYLSTVVALLHHVRLRPDPALIGPLPQITVVVTAKHEAQRLANTLPHNMAAMPSARFLLAYGGPDAATARLVERLKHEHHGQFDGFRCVGVSKATDLNQVWPHIKTPYVFLLDADELTTERALRIAIKHLEERPNVGVVQGRKTAPRDDVTLMDRFIGAERRFSTMLDHTTYAQLFDAAHFAGSAAVLRREIPPSINGWNQSSLTEDIEFTVRLHTESESTVLYDARMEIREDPPEDFASLVRQRGRWARGWRRVFAMHIGRVLRAGPRIGWRTSFGLARQLFTAVNAPWSVFLPLLGLLWILQGAYHQVPGWLTLTLACFILPSRLVSYATASIVDQDRPLGPRLGRALESIFMGYLWIGLAWLLQLHAIYLEISGTPRRWMRTREDSASAKTP